MLPLSGANDQSFVGENQRMTGYFPTKSFPQLKSKPLQAAACMLVGVFTLRNVIINKVLENVNFILSLKTAHLPRYAPLPSLHCSLERHNCVICFSLFLLVAILAAPHLKEASLHERVV